MKNIVFCFILSFIFIISSCTAIGGGDAPAGGGEITTVSASASTTEALAEASLASETLSRDLPAGAAPPPLPTVISFLAVGDNLIHDNIYKEAGEIAEAANRSGDYVFTPMYEPLRDTIENADIAFINQETPLAGEEFGYSGYPQFNAPQQLGTDLEEVGFDIVNIANNHMLDRRAKGLTATMDFLATTDMFQIGGYKNRADFDTPRIYEREGVKIAMLSFTYGTNGINLDSDSDIFIPQYSDGYTVDENLLRAATLRAEEAADFTIVSMHWGWEGTYEINDEQKKAAEILCAAGADVIIGTHPHVIQNTQWLTSENGNKTLVYYSLGNFISAQTPYYNMVGGMASFNIIKDGDKVFATDPLFIPTMTYFDSNFRDSQVFSLEDFPEEMIKTHGRSSVREMTKAELVATVTDNIDPAFLEDYYKG
jgi:poly-gamma-glutamate synthesis protein (capsule biosynthesis protein)